MAAFVLLGVLACTPIQTAQLEGILQNVDSANGEVTVVTNDGKTVTLTIATEAQIEADGTSSTLDTLEPGASVALEVGTDEQTVQRIGARQSSIEGTIVAIQDSEITVETEGGRSRTLLINDATRFRLGEDTPGTLSDFAVGGAVEVKFDPDSLIAFKIDTGEVETETGDGEDAAKVGNEEDAAKAGDGEDQGKIDGTLVEVGEGEITIETEQGRRLTVTVDQQTLIELGDKSPGALGDLLVGGEVEVEFDPGSLVALRIDVGDAAAETSAGEDEAKVDGTPVSGEQEESPEEGD